MMLLLLLFFTMLQHSRVLLILHVPSQLCRHILSQLRELGSAGFVSLRIKRTKPTHHQKN
jgi:hypothetical protein